MNGKKHHRALIDVELLRQIVNNAACPDCDLRYPLVLEEGDYIARVYCVRCDFVMDDILLQDEYQRRYGGYA